MTNFFKFIGMLVLALAASALNLWFCTKAWHYVAEPMGARPIDFWQAIGIMWTLQLFLETGNERPTQEFHKTLINSVTKSLVCMGFIYVFFGRG